MTKFWIDFFSLMFCFFNCCLTELYSHPHKLFCTIILDFIPLVNKLVVLISDMVGSRLICKPFGVNLKWSNFLRILCVIKNESFSFWYGQDEMLAFYFFFIVSFFVLISLHWCLISFSVVVKPETCMKYGINIPVWSTNVSDESDSSVLSITVSSSKMSGEHFDFFAWLVSRLLLWCDIYILNKEW